MGLSTDQQLGRFSRFTKTPSRSMNNSIQLLGTGRTPEGGLNFSLQAAAPIGRKHFLCPPLPCSFYLQLGGLNPRGQLGPTSSVSPPHTLTPPLLCCRAAVLPCQLRCRPAEKKSVPVLLCVATGSIIHGPADCFWETREAASRLRWHRSSGSGTGSPSRTVFLFTARR